MAWTGLSDMPMSHWLPDEPSPIEEAINHAAERLSEDDDFRLETAEEWPGIDPDSLKFSDIVDEKAYLQALVEAFDWGLDYEDERRYLKFWARQKKHFAKYMEGENAGN